jgi:hypothetical protein
MKKKKTALQWVKASERHQPANQVSAASPEATRRLSHTSRLATDHNDKTKNRSTEMEKQNFKGKDSREKTKNTIFLKAGSNNQKVGAMRL